MFLLKLDSGVFVWEAGGLIFLFYPWPLPINAFINFHELLWLLGGVEQPPVGAQNPRLPAEGHRDRGLAPPPPTMVLVPLVHVQFLPDLSLPSDCRESWALWSSPGQSSDSSSKASNETSAFKVDQLKLLGLLCVLRNQLCLTLRDPMECSTPGFLVVYHLPWFAQTHVHWVGDAIQPSHPLLSTSLALHLSQHQGLFQWVRSSLQLAKVLELQHQSFQWIFRVDFL